MSDLRIKRTNKIIFQAFGKLLEEKPFHQITVNDIAKAALIHRNTFYNHFSDKYILLERFTTYMLDQVLTKKQILTFQTKPFETIYNLYIVHFGIVYKIQSNNDQFLNIIWKEFLKTIIKSSPNTTESFNAIAGFLAIMNWNDVNNSPYKIINDYQKLDVCFAQHRFPK